MLQRFLHPPSPFFLKNLLWVILWGGRYASGESSPPFIWGLYPLPPEGQCHELQNVLCHTPHCQHLGIVLRSSGLHRLQEKCTVLWVVSPIGNCCFFSLLSRHFFPLDFRSLVIMCLGMSFSGFISLDLLSTSWLYNLMSLVKCGSYFIYSFSPSLSSPSRASVWMLGLFLSSAGPWELCLFPFSPLISAFSGWE